MKILVVCYGAGHIEMCLPVIRALRQRQPDWTVSLMALTTAFATACAAGESPMGYRDFCEGKDARLALKYGELLLPGNEHPSVAREESLAYLGFNFLEWANLDGEEAAWARWHREGRYGFLPLKFFKRVLEQLRPCVVVATNSPRSEQAALEAAASLGIPSLCMVDLFALPGDPFLMRRHHATRMTVLSSATRDNLIAAGVTADSIVITGNPAFDSLLTIQARAQGSAWRESRGWQDRHVILWAGHKEMDYAAPPSQWKGVGLGQVVQEQLVRWVLSRDDLCLVVRYHPNEWQDFTPPPAHSRLHWSQPDREGLLPVLLAADQVVVQASTVGVQAAATGRSVVGLSFSPMAKFFNMDYRKLGLGRAADSLDDLLPTLEQGINLPAPNELSNWAGTHAAIAVSQQIVDLAATCIKG
jgi:hypothetical protein